MKQRQVSRQNFLVSDTSHNPVNSSGCRIILIRNSDFQFCFTGNLKLPGYGLWAADIIIFTIGNEVSPLWINKAVSLFSFNSSPRVWSTKITFQVRTRFESLTEPTKTVTSLEAQPTQPHTALTAKLLVRCDASLLQKLLINVLYIYFYLFLILLVNISPCFSIRISFNTIIPVLNITLNP